MATSRQPIVGKFDYDDIHINTTGVPASTYNDGLVLENKTPVNVGNPYQWSAGLKLIAHAFASGIDQKVQWRMYVKPGPAGMSFSGDLVIERSFDGVTWTEIFRLGSNVQALTTPLEILVGTGPFSTITGGVVASTAISATALLSLTNTDFTATGNVVSPVSTCISGTFTLTLPAVGASNSIYYIVNIGTGTITVASGGAYNITNGLTAATTWTLTQGKFLQVISNINGTFRYTVLSYN